MQLDDFDPSDCFIEWRGSRERHRKEDFFIPLEEVESVKLRLRLVLEADSKLNKPISIDEFRGIRIDLDDFGLEDRYVTTRHGPKFVANNEKSSQEVELCDPKKDRKEELIEAIVAEIDQSVDWYEVLKNINHSRNSVKFSIPFDKLPKFTLNRTKQNMAFSRFSGELQISLRKALSKRFFPWLPLSSVWISFDDETCDEAWHFELYFFSLKEMLSKGCYYEEKKIRRELQLMYKNMADPYYCLREYGFPYRGISPL
jgi:hypothetical protein